MSINFNNAGTIGLLPEDFGFAPCYTLDPDGCHHIDEGDMLDVWGRQVHTFSEVEVTPDGKHVAFRVVRHRDGQTYQKVANIAVDIDTLRAIVDLL